MRWTISQRRWPWHRGQTRVGQVLALIANYPETGPCVIAERASMVEVTSVQDDFRRRGRPTEINRRIQEVPAETLTDEIAD